MGELNFSARWEGQPFGFAWKMYLTDPKQQVDLILNGQQVGVIPKSNSEGWSLIHGSLLLKARGGTNTLELRPNIVSSATNPIKDVPPGRSVLIVSLAVNDLLKNRRKPSPAEYGLSLILVIVFTTLLAWILGLHQRRSHA